MGSVWKQVLVVFSVLLLARCSDEPAPPPSEAAISTAVLASIPAEYEAVTLTVTTITRRPPESAGDPKGVAAYESSVALTLQYRDTRVERSTSEAAARLEQALSRPVYRPLEHPQQVSINLPVQAIFDDMGWQIEPEVGVIPQPEGLAMSQLAPEALTEGSAEFLALQAELAKPAPVQVAETPKPPLREKPAPKVKPAPADPEKPAITGALIAEKMFSRDEGDAVTRQLEMELVTDKGKVRRRSAEVFRRTLEDRKETLIRFTAPRSVRGMAFLTHDYHDPAREDEQWMYLPAMRKIRRIPSAERGDFFFGTDFTYNDVKEELKFEPTDYQFDLVSSDTVDGNERYTITGKPSSPDIAAELGYGGVKAQVDGHSWMPTNIMFLDPNGAPLKRVTVSDLKRVGGVWVAGLIAAKNVQSGHSTVFTYSEIEFHQSLDDKIFSQSSLKSGRSRR